MNQQNFTFCRWDKQKKLSSLYNDKKGPQHTSDLNQPDVVHVGSAGEKRSEKLLFDLRSNPVESGARILVWGRTSWGHSVPDAYSVQGYESMF